MPARWSSAAMSICSPDGSTRSDRGHRLLALPGGPRFGCGRIVIGLDPLVDLLQVRPELVDRGPAPEPVSDVDLLDPQARREDDGVRDPRVVVMWVGVLVDVQRALHVEVR